MDKLNIVNTFTNYVDQLRNTECSQKEKVSCFQHIAECILSPALTAHIYYAKHCTTATNVLLMFCEDLDSTVRMSAEENLNRIFRALERTRVSRILMDLYGEIKRNGNQRSLRICLNLFAYYAPHIKERHIKWYAQRLSPCLQIIGQRKETLLLECLSEFVKSFGKYLQMGLTDSETCQLVEASIANIASDCAVKRRCSAQNCISLIESSRNKTLMAKHGLNKVIEMLLSAQTTHVKLGALGFLRILLPLLIRGFNDDCIDDGENPPKKRSRMPYTTLEAPDCSDISITSESKQIIEIFDYCLHLLSTNQTSNHSIINASLEVINAILQAIDGWSSTSSSSSDCSTTAQCLLQLLSNQQLQHIEFLRRRKSLKNQIFQLKNYEMTSAAKTTATNSVIMVTTVTPTPKQPQQPHAASATLQQKDAIEDYDNKNDGNELNKHKMSIVAPAASTSMDELEFVVPTLQDHSNAFKLGMQKIVNVKAQQQEAGVLVETTKSKTTTATTTTPSTTSPIKAKTTPTTITGIHAQDDKRNNVTNDVDVDDNDDVDDDVAHADDDEGHKSAVERIGNVGKQQIKNPKNIQCNNKHEDDSKNSHRDNDDDGNDNIDSDYKRQKQNVKLPDDDNDDDDDYDDFTTLSEINEPQEAFALTSVEPALTATIDVDNLIDAIDATANITETTSKPTQQQQGLEQERKNEQQQQQPQQQEQQNQSMLTANAVACVSVVTVADDKSSSSSQHLSDIDNESFNSIDFEAEITIAGLSSAKATENCAATTAMAGTSAVTAGNITTTNEGNAATIGSFFNNLLTHPSTESMTKLFRTATPAGKATHTKVTSDSRKTEFSQVKISSIDKSEQDGISITSFAAISTPATDTFSLGSMSSISQQLEVCETEKHSIEMQSNSLNEETLSTTTASVTASTAILMDTNTRNTVGDASSDEDEMQLQIERRRRSSSSNRKPNVNPFLKDSPLKQSVACTPQISVNIGNILEQSILYYAARLIAAHFLLTGQPGELQSDVKTRVSIKNLSLSVLGQCVRLAPEILSLSLEISASELQLTEVGEDVQHATAVSVVHHESSSQSSCSPSHSSSNSASPTQPQSDSSSNLGKDYEHLDAGGDVVDFMRLGKRSVVSPFPPPPTLSRPQPAENESLLLEIKDDHFGVSTTHFFLNQPLSRSVDAATLAAQRVMPKSSMQPALSKSEIIETKRSTKVYQSFEDVVPSSPPPRPPKRTKSLRKSFNKSSKNSTRKPAIIPAVNATPSISEHLLGAVKKPRQHLTDVLLFYSHADPILRGGVQQIVGNYLQSSCTSLRIGTHVHLNQLLAILITGLQDDIHTVVIHGLNAFDKAFPLILANYLAAVPRHCCSCCCCFHYQQQQKLLAQRHQRHPENQHEKSKQSATKAFKDIFDNNSNMSCCYPEKNPNDALTRILCSRRTCADPCNAASTDCPSKHFIDNDELIASVLNAIQLKSKNDKVNDDDDDDIVVHKVYKNQDVDVPDSSYLFDDNFDNNDTHVLDGLNNRKLLLLHANNKDTATTPARPQDVAADGKGATAAAAADDDVRLFISPKLLLNKLRLCYHNKYWLVQNKYAEVISNLNYAALREFYIEDNDLVTTYEQIFLNELLQLIGDDDFRVREHAAECLCRLIIQNAKLQQISEQQQQQQKQYDMNIKPSSSKLWSSAATTATASFTSSSSSAVSCPLETFETNFNLLWDFLDYRIFSGMSLPMRNLFTVNSSIAPPLTAPTTTSGKHMNCNHFAASAVQRQMEQEEKLLAKILYRMTNRLMELNDKNSQSGLIYTLKLLLKHFNFADYHRAWTEFNFMEICSKFSYYNYATAVDLNCQNDLIDVTGKLMAGLILTSPPSQQQHHEQAIDNLLTHIMKLLNIYYHIFSNQKPLLFAKAQKTDLFTNAKELAIVQSWGYFGNDYVYIKLYNILRSANDSYKITINQASGSILMSLLKTCINTLSLCIEMRSHGASSNNSKTSNTMTTPLEVAAAAASTTSVYPATAVLKLIEEILQYLTKLINYAAGECIACLKQLLKYLFARNYGNRQQDYLTTFIQPYWRARTRPQQREQRREQQQQQEYLQKGQQDSVIVAATMTASTSTSAINSRLTTTTTTVKPSSNKKGHNLIASRPLDWAAFGDLIGNGLTFHDWKSEREAECARHIKLFEPLVNNCLTLFLKSNACIQAPILELLSQLLDLNVTYSVLDSKNVIFDQIMNNLDLIEGGIARNGPIIIPPMMKFLVQLTTKSDRKLITIPKIISITNNLLANNAIRDIAVLALKSLAYEIFFMNVTAAAAETTTAVLLEKQRAAFQSPISCSPTATPDQQRRNQLTADEAAAVAEALDVTSRELDTQKEVMLGMLEKFIDANECQHVLGLLLLRERSMQEQRQLEEEEEATSPQQPARTEGLQDPGAVYSIICRALCEGRIQVNGWCDFFVLDALFKNCGKLVLADSKDFLSLLQLFITKDVKNFSNLSFATIILENVILKTEEIYLVNHIKLYLKNHHHSHSHKERGIESQELQQQHQQRQTDDTPSTSTAAATAVFALGSDGHTLTNNHVSTATSITINEINYFAKVLCEKLDECFAKLNGHSDGPAAANNKNKNNFWHDGKYCGLVVRFIRALHKVCCCSRLQDALQSVFRLVLKESHFLEKHQQLLTVGIAAGPTSIAASQPVNDVGGCLLDVTLQLQLELLKLLSALRLLDTIVILKQLQAQDIRWNVRRTHLREICEHNSNGMNWNLQQVEQLFHPAFLNILIEDNFAFVCNLCEVDEEFCSLWLSALIDNYVVLHRHSIRILARYALHFCTRNCRINCIAKFLALLSKLHHAVESNNALGQLIERTARNLISSTQHQDKNAIYDSFIRMDEEGEEGVALERSSGGRLQYLLLNDLENLNIKANHLQFEQKIIDEKWLFSQLIKFSSQPDYDPEKLTRILLDIQSEHKLHKIFNTVDFDVGRILGPAITGSLQEMLATFRNNCIQHNPHIHYMQPNPLARVACAVLRARISKELASANTAASVQQQNEMLHLAAAVVALMENIKQIEASALIYIEARFVDKFVREHLLQSEFVATLVRFLDRCCALAKRLFCLDSGNGSDIDVDQQASRATCIYLRCIDALLQQQLIWMELNQREKVSGAFKNSHTFTTHTTSEASDTAVAAAFLTQLQRNRLLCNLLDMLLLASTKTLQNTIFYKIYKPSKRGSTTVAVDDAHLQQHAEDVLRLSIDVEHNDNYEVDDNDDIVAATVLVKFYPTAIFIAKLIETQIDIDAASGRLSSAHISGRSGAAGIGASLTGVAIGANTATSTIGVGVVGGVAGNGSALHCDDYFTGIDVENGAQAPMNLLKSIGISILRTNQFYAYAVTPLEIIQQQQQQQQLQREQQTVVGSTAFSVGVGGVGGAAILCETPTKRAATTAMATATTTTAIGKLPTIPVESLSDVDVLRKFVKRLSIFGFTTRQQFEEYFMTFLLLINKVYDKNMVDQQEEFQIKSTCLDAILELLITYKTFPIVGNKLSSFHHTTRWSRINCDSISLKKLHKVQFVVSAANIFYFANFERHLVANSGSSHLQDCIIGTKYFLSNQMDLNFIWQQMENFSQPASPNDDGNDGTNNASTTTTATSVGSHKSKPLASAGISIREDVATKNYRYFTANSGIDFKSSSQLIFDVMMQIIEHNHVLVLPNLVKFCEICESRDQIKWLKDKALKMQETIPMDDTISHQHIIYLLCKTQAMLIPTFGELQQLCTLIANYLRSSHVFIRNATLAGLLSLLECCTKTNTSIGKLSEELALLRELIVNYINRHGLIDQSSIQCSTQHAKLVWTLNFSLIEWTSKFVPQCHLLSNAIIAASNFLRKTTNEDVYLCVLHGLERMIVVSSISGSNNHIVPTMLHHKIEKLALELVKIENEKFSIPALKLLLSCMYVGSAKQLESTELSNGIVQDDPEIIAQQTDKVDILLHCIKSSSRNAAWIYGQVLCQIIRDLVPPNEILTKVIKEFLAINQPHCDVIAMIVYQVFRSAIDSSFLQMLQDWLICSLPTFLALPEQKGVWALSVIFLSASINLHLIKLFPVVLVARKSHKLGQHEIALFVTAAQDFHAKLSAEQKIRFRDAFQKFQQNQIYSKMLHSL